MELGHTQWAPYETAVPFRRQLFPFCKLPVALDPYGSAFFPLIENIALLLDIYAQLIASYQLLRLLGLSAQPAQPF